MSTSKNVGASLLNFVIKYIKDNGLNEGMVKDVPRKWERYGDMVLLNRKNFSDPDWFKLPTDFWLMVCEILKCNRLALKGYIQQDGYRTPSVELLVGDDPWVLCKDNGIKYCWNVFTSMFSAGNAPERQRIAHLNCVGEVIVDLYAGIGYFTLPYLVKAKASFVYACEWNSNAVKALRKNLELNKVSDRCKIFEGDNRLVGLDGVADKVNLGLIPSSESGWLVACRALKPMGGLLLIHGNVETLKPYNKCELCPLNPPKDNLKWKYNNWYLWSSHVLHSITELISGIREISYKCSVVNVHHVKSYAPHVDHLVLDVSVTPLTDL